MVELCELNLMPTDAANFWPADMDEHVAQLDFGDTSMMEQSGQQSVFASIMCGADPTMISTDSLDMDVLRARCENNKHNDYKLTFEDSGQWTTSGIGGSFTTTTNTTNTTMTAESPPTPQTRRRLKQLRSREESGLLLNDLDNQNFSLQLMEKLNNTTTSLTDADDGKTTLRWKKDQLLLDEILNNNNRRNTANNWENTKNCGDTTTFPVHFGGAGQPLLTTWGRIGNGSEGRDQQPAFDADKISSSPELNRTAAAESAAFSRNSGNNRQLLLSKKGKSSPTVSATAAQPTTIVESYETEEVEKRPRKTGGGGSLVVNFIEQQRSREEAEEEEERSTLPRPRYEYTEIYLDDGRYIDMNENEIGFVPPNTSPIQRAGGSGRAGTSGGANCSKSMNAGMPPKSPRTFADLSSSKTVPDLKFIALGHKVPSICSLSSLPSTDALLKRAKAESSVAGMLECCADSEKLLSELATTDSDGNPDSGMGGSSSCSEGPSHIEDWPSLSMLLPRHVVQACSFFRTNSFLLSGTSGSSGNCTNNIERGQPPRSFTSSGIVRRLNSNNHKWNQQPVACPNCVNGANSEGLTSRSAFCLQQEEQQSTMSMASSSAFRATTTTVQRLHAKELALVGLPVYDQKRALVEAVVEGVAEIVRGGSSLVLVTALEKLLSDGLKQGQHAWTVIVRMTGQGPVTASVFQLIRELEAAEKPPKTTKYSRVKHFFQGLIGLHSVDGWFSYIVLKETALNQFFVDTSFFLGAQTSYRSLFARFMESLELLSVFNQCGRHNRRRRSQQQKHRNNNFASMDFCSTPRTTAGASRLPNDSRVPKSSSMPTKLASSRNFLGWNQKNQDVEEEEESKVASSSSATTKIPTIREPTPPKRSRIPVLRSRSKSMRASPPAKAQGC